MLSLSLISSHPKKVTTDHADGTWGVGEYIDLLVKFTGPVMLVDGSDVRVRLEVGDTVIDRTEGPINATTSEGDDQGTIKRRIAYADYISGNNTAHFRFRCARLLGVIRHHAVTV